MDSCSIAPRETMPRGDLAALQLRRLQQTVERAYAKVPHVRQTFDAAKVRPDQIKTLADVSRLPFSTKADLRDNFPFGLFAVPREQLLRLHASSGTTGKPTVVGYTRDDLDLWSNLMARSLACMGARPGDIFHNAFGYGLFTGGLGFHYGAERLGLTTIPVSGGGTERQVALMQDLRPQILGATPSYALNIAEVAERLGVDLRKLSLRYAACGAEPWSEAMRARHPGETWRQGHGLLWPVRDHRPGCRQRMPRGAGWSALVGGPFPVRGDRSRHDGAAAAQERPESLSSRR